MCSSGRESWVCSNYLKTNSKWKAGSAARSPVCVRDGVCVCVFVLAYTHTLSLSLSLSLFLSHARKSDGACINRVWVLLKSHIPFGANQPLKPQLAEGHRCG